MSVVTNCLLSLGIGDGEKLGEVNKFFEDETLDNAQKSQRGFVDVDEIRHGWYGGSKYLEVNLSMAAFNFLNLQGLIEHIRKIQFVDPDSVQLLVLGQQDDRFEIINVFEETP